MQAPKSLRFCCTEGTSAAFFQRYAQGVGEVQLIGANYAFRLFHIRIIGWGGFIPMRIVRQKRSQIDAPWQLARDRNE